MTVRRFLVTMVPIFLITYVLVLAHAKDVTTLEYDDLLPATETNARQRVDADALMADHRQGRMSLHAELPASKAKREQALRNILAARRRQILSQRPFESRASRTPRPSDTSPKDSPDILEAQETKHGMYVTAQVKDEDASEPSVAVPEKIVQERQTESDESVSQEPEQPAPHTSDKSNDSFSSDSDDSPAPGSSKINYSSGHKNPFLSSPASAQKTETETRKRNTVSMPESLYNYFRPVESNIPIEDMSQFLYFGQKIQPEAQNSTGNNSVEMTPTVPTSLTSRRRYTLKRLGTTSAPARLEEIVNEEMNIAVERQTVEKNKVSKMKNSFRSPESALFYRKPRPTESTIANVIPIREHGRNSTETDASGDKFHDDNPSAHAATQDQLQQHALERGSAATHVLAETRNATQIPHRQPVSANAYEETTVESEISLKDRPTDISGESLNRLAGGGPKGQRRRKDSSTTVDPDVQIDPKEILEQTNITEMHGDHSEQQMTRADMNLEMQADHPRSSNSRESNNIETSTSRDKMSRSDPWTTPELETSTLRIIVTEGNLEQSSSISNDPGEKYTVKPVDSTEERVRASASGDTPTPSTITTTQTIEPQVDQATSQGTIHQPRQNQEHQHREQHVYAYTITNVTRLLRNYTGPGLSKEEQGGPQRSTGTVEITTGSPQRRQPPPSLLPRAGIEVARAPAELSTGTTVEPATAGRLSAATVVGEPLRKVAALEPQLQQQNTRLGSLTVNKSKPTEVTTRGAVRWNHTKARNSDLEGLSDRRVLRKSASAVLNQRIGLANDEDAAIVIAKRRRVIGQASFRRVKGSTFGKAAEEPLHRRNLTGRTEDAAEGRGIQETMRIAVIRESDVENRTMENATKERFSTEATIDSTTGILNGMEKEKLTGAATPRESETDTKDKNTVVLSESESSNVTASNEMSNVDSRRDNDTDNEQGSSTVTVTETPEERFAAKETLATTIPTPIFPVTPRIITEAGRVAIEQETFTLKPTESVNQLTDAKTTEPNRPFGVAANLDPSEIQKMYRSKNATTETTTYTTTISQEVEPKIETTTDTSRKMGSSERSPEVRARNLSDKSKDKDDVLPIMHLYNTSDIFNGSVSKDSFGRATDRPQLPTGNGKPEVSREGTGDTVTPKTVGNSSRVPDSKEIAQPTSRKEESRETVSPTGPGRGSANRTRQKGYHPASLPEYNSSVYHGAELNRTFFEGGLVSVSPRESVNISEVISKRHDGDAIASQETVAVVSYILATLVVFPIAVGVGLILRRLILRNRKVLEESDTSSEISCRKDALNLENGDFKTSIEKAITKLPRIQHLCHEAEKPPPPSSQESRWEFPRDKLRLQTVLGQGNFGQVWKAEADDLTGHQGTTRLVAVKTVKEGASDREKEDLVRELEIMQQLGSHPNVVTLLGCCTEEEPHYLILEYVMYGKLLAYLRDHRTRQDFYNFSEDSAALTSRDLTVFGYCVARGMEYLASKKIIHRDLAARNVLVDHNKLCKIADFGMSRFANEDGEVIETRHGRNALPIRWMAPESLIYSLFTTKTDVWSFGILMWEIVTLGSTPYPDMTAREVMRNVQNGYRLERPSHCRSELFRVISRCWHVDPDRRPEFQTLRRDLAQLLEDNMNGHYVDLESFASECTD